MKQYPILRSRISQIAFAVYLAAALVLPRDSALCSLLLGFYPSQAIFLGLTAFLAAWFFGFHFSSLPEILRDRRMLWALICTAVCLLPMVFKRDWQLMYFSVLICVYLGIFFTFFTDIETVSRYYVVFMVVLSIYSVLAAYILRISADNDIWIPQIVNNTNDIPFYNYYLSFVPIWYVKNRNWGIFREPGVYQYFLMLAIYLNNYHIDWKKPVQLWAVNIILMLTMVTTFATGGVIALFLFVIVLFFDKKYNTTRQGRLIALSCIGLGILAAVFIVLQHGVLYSELYLMMHKFVEGEDSITDRIGSPLANLSFFLSSPLFGVKIRAILYSILNNTSSSTILFAMLGLAGGVLNVAGWFALVWKKERPIFGNLALLAILALTFNTENLVTNPYLWIMPMMALTVQLHHLTQRG